MDIYIYVFFILSLLVIISYLTNIRWIVIVSAIGLGLFAGNRSINVGPDTIRYFASYTYSKGNTWGASRFEPGYVFFEKIFSYFDAPTSIFLTFFSLMSMLLLSIFLFKYSPIPMASLTYYYSRYFLVRDMNQIRQSMAAILLLYSIKYLTEKKIGRFIFIVLLAALFHKAALVMIIPYIFINLLHFNQKDLLKKYLISLVICLALSLIVSPFLNRIFILFGIDTSYLTNDAFTTSLGLANPVLILEVVLSIILAILIFKKKAFLKDFEISIVLVYMIGSLILVLFHNYSVVSGRLSTLLTTSECILMIYLVKLCIPKKGQLISLILVSTIIFFLINYSGGSVLNYLPY